MFRQTRPEWDAPPDGDFARYVERLTSAQASAKPSAPVQPQPQEPKAARPPSNAGATAAPPDLAPLWAPFAGALQIVRSVLHTLEQQYVMVSLVRDMLNRGLSVAIGAEHGVEPLAACSVVLAPVVADGATVGTVGVLGPTRMNYPQALATVEVVSDRLGRRLAEG